MRDVWQDAREFRQCRKAKIGRDASWWDDHTCTMASGSSLRMERMVSALVTASREANNLFREVSYCSHDPWFDTERDIPDVETSNWRAVCGKTASTVRREGRREPSLPLSRERQGRPARRTPSHPAGSAEGRRQLAMTVKARRLSSTHEILGVA